MANSSPTPQTPGPWHVVTSIEQGYHLFEDISHMEQPEMMPYAQLYHPVDVEEAYVAWHASCGPAALAAVLGRPVQRVRAFFPDWKRKRYTNPSTMYTAIALAGRRAHKTGTQWPLYGLACVQWHGPWLSPGVPIGAAYRRMHWIAIAHTWEYGRMVYDVNVWSEPAGPDTERRGAWTPYAYWTQEIVPAIAETIPKATGDWSLRWTCHVVQANHSPALGAEVGEAPTTEDL